MLDFSLIRLNEPETIKQINESYGGSLRPEAVRYLEKQGLLQDVQLNRITPQKAANKVAEIWGPPANRGRESAEKLKNGVSPTEKSQAFSVSGVMAQKARQEQKVKAFRESYLPDGLLPENGIESWINRTAKREGPLGLEWEPDMKNPILVFESKTMPLPTSTFVAIGGVLDELRRLCELLAFAYGWPPGQAATFVLSDVTPINESIQVRAEINSHLPFNSRITLKIDPTMSPKDVAHAYEWARDEFFEKRSRRQSVKFQTLALFYAQTVAYAENKEKRKAILSRWNEWCASEKKKGWQYDAVTNFQRDSRNAYMELVRDRRKEK